MKDIQLSFGVDVDAVAGWLGSYGGEDSPSDIQRGVFAAEVGIPRLLTLFERFSIETSWFVPGHSIESFPGEIDAVIAAGHEIGAHGYSHENPIQMSPQQEQDVLERSIELIVAASGSAPRGYVAPWWEVSANSHGFVDPRVVESLWRDQFDWVYREMDDAVFPITIHPDVSGRPQVLMMLERFIDYVNGHDGVSWKKMESVAD